MIDTLALRLDDARLVVKQGVGVHPTRNRTTMEDLLHHGISTRDGAVVRNCRIGEFTKACARSTLLGEASTRPGHVQSLARRVDVLAEPFIGVRGAGNVRICCLIADSGALLGNLHEPLVRAVDAAALARAHATAVQQVLNRKVDVDSLCVACDLDAVTKSGDGTVGPA